MSAAPAEDRAADPAAAQTVVQAAARADTNPPVAEAVRSALTRKGRHYPASRRASAR
jgi:hypothetical protein